MKKKILSLSLIAIISFACIYSMVTSYHVLRLTNKILIKEALVKAIDIDKDIRFKRLNAPLWIGSIPEDNSEYTTLEHDKKPTVRIKRSNTIKNMGQTEKLNHVLQTYLHSENPVKVISIDSIFNQELQKRQLTTQTAIRYIDNINGKSVISCNDSAFLKSANATDTLTYGILKEVSFQGYARVPASFIVNRGKSQFLGISLIWLTSFLLLAWWGFATAKPKNIVDIQIPNSEIDEPSNSHLQISEELILDTKLCLLIKKERKIRLTGQSVQILELLLNSPDCYLKYDELILKLWGKVESKGQERLIQSIKRLRESLKWCPEITIENIRKEGYRLLVKAEQ